MGDTLVTDYKTDDGDAEVHGTIPGIEQTTRTDERQRCIQIALRIAKDNEDANESDAAGGAMSVVHALREETAIVQELKQKRIEAQKVLDDLNSQIEKAIQGES